jgi:prepilin-type N-terminal cleavage/methylation domain-containing protein
MRPEAGFPIFARQYQDFARPWLAARPSALRLAARPRPGFTLLEVLAAVAILGGLYVVLADVAMQGLRAEGESQRRLEASLLADYHLSELEIQLEAGIAPELGRTESEEDAFRIELDVKPFEISLPDLRTDTGVVSGLPLPADDPGAAALEALRAIELTVSWLEGEEERSVVRTTYAFDLEAVSELLEGPGGGDENR